MPRIPANLGAYLAAPAYVLGMMAVTVGPYLWQPYTGNGPPGTYVGSLQPAPRLAKDETRHPHSDPLKPRLVQVERIKPVKVPPECRDLAASAGLPTNIMTQDQARKARAMLEATKQSRAIRRCRITIERNPT